MPRNEASPQTAQSRARRRGGEPSLLGEAARHVDDEVAGEAPEVPWADIRGMRNVVMHEYFGVDLTTVWKTVSDDLAPLRTALLALLARMEPDA